MFNSLLHRGQLAKLTVASSQHIGVDTDIKPRKHHLDQDKSSRKSNSQPNTAAAVDLFTDL
jgi:hypothetical protein